MVQDVFGTRQHPAFQNPPSIDVAELIFRDPFMGQLLRGQLPQFPSRSALPTASSSMRYRPVVVRGTPDIIYICLRNASGTYGWRSMGAANGGTATIASGTTAITVAHGLGTTPLAQNISVIATNNPTNDPGNLWVSAIDGTNFDINCRADPGAGGLALSWQAVL